MNRVVVTGLGFISSIGNDRAAVLQSLREGRCGIEVMPELAAANDRVKLAGTVKGFSFPTADPLDWTFPAHVQFSRSQLRTLVPNAVFASVAMDAGLIPGPWPARLRWALDQGRRVAQRGGTWSRKARHTVVLPAPISPVSSTKPPPPETPYSRCASASRCWSLMNRKRGSGAMEKGSLLNPKNDAYMPRG